MLSGYFDVVLIAYRLINKLYIVPFLSFMHPNEVECEN